MTDVVDSSTRSRMMAGIRSRNTQPEVAIRQALHAAGFRFRLHARALPGSPDIVLPKWRAAIMIHGCFWHQHPGCRFATKPTTRPEFWAAKFAKNRERDARNSLALRAQGWRVATVWECALKEHDKSHIINILSEWIRSSDGTLELEIS